MPTNLPRIVITLPRDLDAKIRERAKEEKKSLSKLIVMLLTGCFIGLITFQVHASNNSDFNELKKEAPNYFQRIDNIFVEMTGNHAIHDELWHFGMNMADGNTDEKELRHIINFVKAQPGYVQGPLRPTVVCEAKPSVLADAFHLFVIGAEVVASHGLSLIAH